MLTGNHGNYLAPSILAAGLEPANVPESDSSKMNFDGRSAQATKAICGCGQGIGVINKVQGASEFVTQVKRGYATDWDIATQPLPDYVVDQRVNW